MQLTVRLSAYIDGELDLVRAEDLESVLESNPSAKLELQQLAETSALIEDAFALQLAYPVPRALAQNSAAMAVNDNLWRLRWKHFLMLSGR